MEQNRITDLIQVLEEKQLLSEEMAFLDIKETVPVIIEVYTELLRDIPLLQEEGIEVTDMLILQQLKNMELALQRRDVALLYDVINYEILNTLRVYLEIRRRRAGN